MTQTISDTFITESGPTAGAQVYGYLANYFGFRHSTQLWKQRDWIESQLMTQATLYTFASKI